MPGACTAAPGGRESRQARACQVHAQYQSGGGESTQARAPGACTIPIWREGTQTGKEIRPACTTTTWIEGREMVKGRLPRYAASSGAKSVTQLQTRGLFKRPLSPLTITSYACDATSSWLPLTAKAPTLRASRTTWNPRTRSPAMKNLPQCCGCAPISHLVSKGPKLGLLHAW